MARLVGIVSKLLQLPSSDIEGFHLGDFHDLEEFHLEESDSGNYRTWTCIYCESSCIT